MKGSWEGHNRSKHIRIQWLRNQSKVKALQTDLRSINTNLTACLTTQIVSGQVHLQTSLQEVAQATEQVFTDKSGLTRAIHTKFNLQDDHLAQLSEQILHLQANNENQQGVQNRNEEILGSSSSGIQQADNTGVKHYTASRLEDTTENMTLKSLDRYSGSCTCCCYPKSRIQITEVLRSMIGSMSISYFGGQISRRCQQASCGRKLPTTLNLTYYFPRWLLTKVVSVSLSFDPAGSPSMSLQMPHIRPDTSKIFHLATAGDIGGMKTMFESGLASPNDVSYTFGYSVLHVCIIPWQHCKI